MKGIGLIKILQEKKIDYRIHPQDTDRLDADIDR